MEERLQGRQLFIEALKEVDLLIEVDPGGAEDLLAWIDERISKLTPEQVNSMGPQPHAFLAWVLNEMGVRHWRLVREELPRGPLQYFHRAEQRIALAEVLEPDTHCRGTEDLLAAVYSNLAFCRLDVGDGSLESIEDTFLTALTWQRKAEVSLLEQAETMMGLARTRAYRHAGDERRIASDVISCAKRAIEAMHEDMINQGRTDYGPEHVLLLIEQKELPCISGFPDPDGRFHNIPKNNAIYHAMELPPSPDVSILRSRATCDLALEILAECEEWAPSEKKQERLKEAQRLLLSANQHRDEAERAGRRSWRLELSLDLAFGILERESGQIEWSLQCFERALELSAILSRDDDGATAPFLVGLHHHAGKTYRAAGDLDQARYHLERAREIAMSLEMSPIVIGRLAHALGELDGRRAFSKAPRPVMGSPGLAV
jgi:hypothetical protein